MENRLQIFNNKKFGNVRVLEINNEPYFVGKDVAMILGYSNPQKAIRDHVNNEDKTVNDSFIVNGTQGVLINEAGVYSLVFRSKLPKAREFEKWVRKEVLPMIRKHGMYMTEDVFTQLMNDPAKLGQMLIDYGKTLEENRKQQLQIQEQQQEIEIMQPKASYYDKILQSKDLLTVTEIAKDYGMSARRFNELLSEFKIQYKQGGTWFLYSKYQDKNYTKTKTTSFTHKDGSQGSSIYTAWTQEGRLFLYELLKANNIVPMFENYDDFDF